MHVHGVKSLIDLSVLIWSTFKSCRDHSG